MYACALNYKWNITSISNKHSLSNALFDPIKLDTYTHAYAHLYEWVHKRVHFDLFAACCVDSSVIVIVIVCPHTVSNTHNIATFARHSKE